jgi:hypothetical protein
MTRLKTQDAVFRGEPCVEHTYCVARRQWPASSRRR